MTHSDPLAFQAGSVQRNAAFLDLVDTIGGLALNVENRILLPLDFSKGAATSRARARQWADAWSLDAHRAI